MHRFNLHMNKFIHQKFISLLDVYFQEYKYRFPILSGRNYFKIVLDSNIYFASIVKLKILRYGSYF